MGNGFWRVFSYLFVIGFFWLSLPWLSKLSLIDRLNFFFIFYFISMLLLFNPCLMLLNLKLGVHLLNFCLLIYLMHPAVACGLSMLLSLIGYLSFFSGRYNSLCFPERSRLSTEEREANSSQK
jgi:hypothetical protein